MTETDHDTSIPVCSLSKEDLLSARPDLEDIIAAMTIAEVDRLADKLSDALMETYWMALDIILDDEFGEMPEIDDDDMSDE